MIIMQLNNEKPLCKPCMKYLIHYPKIQEEKNNFCAKIKPSLVFVIVYNEV